MDAREARDHRDRRRDGPAHGRARLLLAGALIALLASGCGSEPTELEPPRSGHAPPAIELTVVFWPQGHDGPAQEATLTCDPAGGTHPRPAEACDALQGDADALAPLPPDSVCTQIFGGPEEAEVRGTLDGETVEAAFSRQNGCEIDRWDRLEPLLRLVSGRRWA